MLLGHETQQGILGLEPSLNLRPNSWVQGLCLYIKPGEVSHALEALSYCYRRRGDANEIFIKCIVRLYTTPHGLRVPLGARDATPYATLTPMPSCLEACERSNLGLCRNLSRQDVIALGQEAMLQYQKPLSCSTYDLV